MLVIVVSLSWSDDGYADETTSRRPSGPTRSDTRNETRSRLNDAKRTSDAKRTAQGGGGGTGSAAGRPRGASVRGDPPDVRWRAGVGAGGSGAGRSRPSLGWDVGWQPTPRPAPGSARRDDDPLRCRHNAPPVHRRCRSQRRCTHSDVLKYFGFASCRCSAVTRGYQALTYVRTRQAWTKLKDR